jgi:multidrug efflux pump subunit AcrA (membrane-fusion protein)
MRLARRHVLIAVALALVAIAAVFIWARLLRAVPAPQHELRSSAVAVRVAGPETVQARVPVTLAPRITATVTQLNADVGDSVRRGQVLVLLDDRDLSACRGVVGGQRDALERNETAGQAALARAQAELNWPRANRKKRDADLPHTGFVSASVLAASDAALRAAQASVDNARARRWPRAGPSRRRYPRRRATPTPCCRTHPSWHRSTAWSCSGRPRPAPPS